MLNISAANRRGACALFVILLLVQPICWPPTALADDAPGGASGQESMAPSG